MRIVKINYNPSSGKVVIEYDHKKREGHDLVRSRLVSKDQPHPSFLAALVELQVHVEELCEVPPEFVHNVRGFSVKLDEDDPDLSTVMFVATRKVGASNSPLVLNTPAVVPTGDLKIAVDAALADAKLYLEGTRAQQELPGTTTKVSKSAKKKAASKKKAKKEEPTLGLGEESDNTVVDLGDEGTVEEVETPKEEERTLPPEEKGQVYQAKSSLGSTCTVKQQAGGWYGRVSGKPIAKDQPGARAAMDLVNDWTKETLDWKPTLKLDGAAAQSEDLTGGL